MTTFNLLRLRRCFQVGMLVGCALMTCAGGHASTTPVKGDTSGTDQPGVTTPIYSNIPTSAAAPSAPGNGPTAEQLLVRFMDEHSATNYPAAVETAVRLVQIAPDRPHGHYNLACALSRLRRIDEALASLDASLDAGWRDLRHMSMDPDLAAVRASGGYGRIVDKLNAMLSQERVQPGPLRTDEWQQVVADLTSQSPAILAKSHVTAASIALIHDGTAVWSGEFANGSFGEVPSAGAPARYRLRRPVELLGLLAGAQLQQQGRLELARIIQEGAELGQSVRGRSGAAAQPKRDQPPNLTIVPIGRNDGEHERNAATTAAIDPSDPTMSLLRLSVEIVSNQTFDAYCMANLVEPMDMTQTTFARPSADASAIATGHSPLGTPVAINLLVDGPTESSYLYTTAPDMARLVEALIDPSDAGASADANPINLLARINLLSPGNRANDTGLTVQVKALDTGRCVQLVEVTDGVGCLIRWHARTRNGIIILFDSATGGDAALRIAHLALGGE